MPPPEIETPHPSELGGKKGKRGETEQQDAIQRTKVYRVLRYGARSTGAGVLTVEAMRMQQTGETDKRYLGDVFRMIDCGVRRHGYFVKVSKHATAGTANYAGLVSCGSVWACPVCAAKIQERRRCEIEQAISWHAEVNDGESIMVTMTFPHVQFDSLADLLNKQARAFKYLRETRAWRELMQSAGFVGLIRSLEVTHGQNGWHPHTHELWMVRKGVVPILLRSRIIQLWEDACVRAGLLDPAGNKVMPFRTFSVDVKTDVDSGDYLAKQDDSRRWGLASEVAKASSKLGRAKGVHPHHFLVRQQVGDDQLYLEYVRGMKGRRQLFWSPRLKGKVGIVEVSDEVLAEQEEKGAQLLAAIPAPAWKVVLADHARCELLEAAEANGFDGVVMLLRSLGVPDVHLPLTPDEFRDSLEYLYGA